MAKEQCSNLQNEVNEIKKEVKRKIKETKEREKKNVVEIENHKERLADNLAASIVAEMKERVTDWKGRSNPTKMLTLQYTSKTLQNKIEYEESKYTHILFDEIQEKAQQKLEDLGFAVTPLDDNKWRIQLSIKAK